LIFGSLRSLLAAPKPHRDVRGDWANITADPASPFYTKHEELAKKLASDAGAQFIKYFPEHAGQLQESQEFWTFMGDTASHYLWLLQQWSNNSPEAFRTLHERIVGPAAELLDALEGAPADALIGLNVLMSEPDMPLQLRGDLWDPLGIGSNDLVPLTVYLSALIRALHLQEPISGKQGRRTRHHVRYLIAAAADLWTALTGARFPKNRLVGMSRSAHFAALFAQSFDQKLTAADIDDGIKALPVQN